MSPTLEICVDGPAGIDAAVSGGADRLELCAGLELGGLTPSPALVARGVETGLPVHVLIRPRAGDFVIGDDEREVMLADIAGALSLGAGGVVVGASLADGRLDREALARFRDAARQGVAVLHRAIDLMADPVAAVEEAVRLGYDKVLSSGGALTAIEGRTTLARMVAAATDRLSVIAASGVRPENVSALVDATGVREVHSSASSPAVDWNGPILQFGFASAARRRTDAAVVAALKASLKRGESGA